MAVVLVLGAASPPLEGIILGYWVEEKPQVSAGCGRTEGVTLAEFLLQRIADDAKWGRDRQHEDFRKHRLGSRRTHLAPDDPIRVLAESAGKRRIVEECGPGRSTAAAGLADRVLRELALPYADHPDYREEWRP